MCIRDRRRGHAQRLPRGPVRRGAPQVPRAADAGDGPPHGPPARGRARLRPRARPRRAPPRRPLPRGRGRHVGRAPRRQGARAADVAGDRCRHAHYEPLLPPLRHRGARSRGRARVPRTRGAARRLQDPVLPQLACGLRRLGAFRCRRPRRVARDRADPEDEGERGPAPVQRREAGPEPRRVARALQRGPRELDGRAGGALRRRLDALDGARRRGLLRRAPAPRPSAAAR